MRHEATDDDTCSLTMDGSGFLANTCGTGVQIWDLRQTRSALTTLRDEEDQASAVAMDGSGVALLVGSDVGAVRLWEQFGHSRVC